MDEREEGREGRKEGREERMSEGEYCIEVCRGAFVSGSEGVWMLARRKMFLERCISASLNLNTIYIPLRETCDCWLLCLVTPPGVKVIGRRVEGIPF